MAVGIGAALGVLRSFALRLAPVLYNNLGKVANVLTLASGFMNLFGNRTKEATEKVNKFLEFED